MKDNFSDHSSEYSRFRLVYPKEVIEYLISLPNKTESCWDCATGNGQLAVSLSEHFDHVYATDMSQKQLANAVLKPNVYYSQQTAESTQFRVNQFDMVTVAQAVHWFEFDRFFAEVERVLKPNGVLALLGYGLLRIDDKIDKIIDHLYFDIIGPYWDPERKYIDHRYANIPFPLKEEVVPSFELKKEMTMDQLVGYLRTWSAVQHFIRDNGFDPIDEVEERLKAVWPAEFVLTDTPFFMRVGRII